jgi:threonylcarbamoyladenosine tRNA methylthiotransferase MtaB
VKEEVELLVENGFREVVLCGIHLGVYGQDLQPTASLLDLLGDLEEETEIPRIRISSIEPNELTEELLALFSNSRRLCPHFHLPLQSGDPDVLRAMDRPYGPDEFASLVNRIREAMPDAAIGVDVIAGFPGEGEAAFQSTLHLLEDLPVTYFHVFPFSPRPGTAAARFPDRVPPDQIQRRAQVLRKVGMGKRIAFYTRFLNREQEVLVETKRDRVTGMLKGVSRNYIPVLFEGLDSLQRMLVQVEIHALCGKQVFGVLGKGETKGNAETRHLDNQGGSDRIENLVSKREKPLQKSLVRE